MTLSREMRENLVARATAHVMDILNHAIAHSQEHRAFVVYDTSSELACILRDAYSRALPDAKFIDFSLSTKESILAAFDTLSPRDLVVLIQSTDFRLNAFRIRIHLFQKKLKVIDHLHLLRNREETWGTYIDALAYDPLWYRDMGKKLKTVLEGAEELRILSGEFALTCTGGLETPKLNVGDYAGMENIGGTFPIGEVFTENKDLGSVSGSIMIYAFADTDFHIAMHEPFRVDILQGEVVGWSTNAPAAFSSVIESIKTNERPILREIGFGLNRAITREHYLNDITAFERTYGLHFSLGEKHTVYKKAGIQTDKSRFHVDVFPIVDRVIADDTVIFSNEKYQL